MSYDVIIRRRVFEEKIDQYHDDIDKLKEESPQNVVDIKKLVAHLEGLSDNLEAANEEAKVKILFLLVIINAHRTSLPPPGHQQRRRPVGVGMHSIPTDRNGCSTQGAL